MTTADMVATLASVLGGAQVVIAVLAVGACLVVLLGATGHRDPAIRCTVAAAAASILLGLGAWTLSIIGPFPDPNLLHRLWLPLGAALLAGAVVRLATHTGPRPPERS